MENKRPVIALFMSTPYDPYQIPIIKGMTNWAEQEDVTLVIINGGAINVPLEEHKHLNMLYTHITPDIFDGIILLSGAIKNYVTNREFGDFIKSYHDIPKVSVGISVPDIPSIVVDNAIGIYKLVEHLIKSHGCKKIVFVKGPDNNEEAIDRFEGYKRALKDNDILFDENLIFDGKFEKEDGGRAVKELKKKGIDFDALIGVDDLTAFGAFESIKSLKFKKTNEIRLGGFDDIDLCTSISPTLSTVRQPLFELGEISLQVILKMVHGERVESLYTIPTNMVIRESCGCSLDKDYIELFAEFRKKETAGLKTPIELLVTDIKHAVETTLCLHTVESMRAGLINSCTDIVIELVSQAISDYKPELLKKQLPGYFTKTLEAGFGTSLWVTILLTIINHFMDYLDSNDKNETVLMLVWNYYVSCLYQVEARILANKAVYEEFIDGLLERIGDVLVSTFDINEIKKEIADSFSNNNIKCQLSLYAGHNTAIKSKSEIFLQLFEAKKKNEKFLTNKLSPIKLDKIETKTLFLMGLHKDFKSIGFALFDISNIDPKYCVLLSNKISRSIVGANMMSQIKNHAEILEKEVAKRTEELRLANEQLRQKSLNDELSGLKNRRFLTEIILPDAQQKVKNLKYKLLHKDRRQPEQLVYYAIFLLDIDHFKHVNDTYGHENGDIIIKDVSHILEKTVRKNDYVIRFGGEEFLVILKEFNITHLKAKAEEIRSSIQDHVFTLTTGEKINKTVSLGCACFPIFKEKPDALSFMESVSLADKALYYAKEHGRNQAVILNFNQFEMITDEQKTLLLNDFERAVEEQVVTLTIVSEYKSDLAEEDLGKIE